MCVEGHLVVDSLQVDLDTLVLPCVRAGDVGSGGGRAGGGARGHLHAVSTVRTLKLNRFINTILLIVECFCWLAAYLAQLLQPTMPPPPPPGVKGKGGGPPPPPGKKGGPPPPPGTITP